MNIGEPWPDRDTAWHRVLVMQTKLHQWAKADPGRRFDDLYNLVYDPNFLAAAWDRVRGNKGARTAGVDGVAPRSITFRAGDMLTDLQHQLKTREFIPAQVRQKSIPKGAGKIRHWGFRQLPTGRFKHR